LPSVETTKRQTIRTPLSSVKKELTKLKQNKRVNNITLSENTRAIDHACTTQDDLKNNQECKHSA